MTSIYSTIRINRQGALWLAFYMVVLTAWIGLVLMAVATPGAGLSNDLLAALCTSAKGVSAPILFGMWALMAAGMMLPTFVPTLRAFLTLGPAGTTKASEALALIVGYTLVWLLGAALGASTQSLLSSYDLLSFRGSSVSPTFTAALLLIAGLYQFSILKAACLSKCRMPLTYFMGRWAPGYPRAFRMGLELGVLCFGCCWALMALAFVGGTMNLWWMGLATMFMILEKLPELGRLLTRPAGYVLLVAAGLTALSNALSL